MTRYNRLTLALVAILFPLFVVGVLLASEPESAPVPSASPVISRLLEENTSQSMLVGGTWPILRHDNGHSGFNRDVGIFGPPLALLDPINLQDVTINPKPIFNIVAGPERIYAMGQWNIWGVDKDDPSVQWRNDDCLPDPGTGDFCFNTYLAYASDKLVVLRQKFFLSTFDFGYELVVLKTTNGSESWSLPLGETSPEIALEDSSILVLREVNSIGKLQKFTIGGSQDFSENADISGFPGGRAVVAGGRFIYVNGDRVLAYNSGDGEPSWIYTPTPHADPAGYDLVATQDSVIVSQDDRVIKLDTATGTLDWEEDIKPPGCADEIQSNGAATDGSIIAITGVCDDEVVGLDYGSGAELWRENIGLVGSNSAIAIGGDVLYVASVTTPIFNIFALDPVTGDELDMIELSANQSSSVLAVIDNHLLTASNIGTKRLLRFERMPADLAAQLELGIADQCGAMVDGEIFFRFDVINNGDGPVDNARAEVVLPPSTTIINPSQGSCTSGTSPVCDLGSLPNGGQASILITSTLTVSGTYPVSITVSGGGVRDPFDDNNSAAASVSIDPLPDESIDLEIAVMEVTQAIQNFNQDIELVATKPTLARAYVRTNGPDVNRVTSVLHGRDASSGQELPGSPLSPVNADPCVDVDAFIPDRSIRRETFNFELPDGWREGSVILEAEVNPNGAIPEQNTSNNAVEQAIDYEILPPMCLVTYPVHTQGWVLGPGGLAYLDLNPGQTHLADNPEITNRTLSLLPTPELWLYQHSNILQEWEIVDYGPYELNDEDDDSWKILNTLYWKKVLSDPPAECRAAGADSNYLGMVHQETQGNFSGIAVGDQLVVKVSTENTGAGFNSPWGGRTLAHELGHNYGRSHIPCGDIAWYEPRDLFYPYDDCELAEDVAGGFFGSDLTNFDRLRFIGPTDAGDLMSYADDRWISDYTWNHIRACLRGDIIECYLPGSATRVDEVSMPWRSSPPISQLDGEMLFITGLVSETVHFVDVLSISESVVPTDTVAIARSQLGTVSSGVSDFGLQLLDTGGNLLYTQSFTPTYISDGGEPLQMFNVIAPYHPDTAEIRVISGTQTISRTVSTNAPTVTVLSPNGGEVVDESMTITWQGDDLDGDELFFSVQYSADLGQSWQLLVSQVPATSVTVDSSLLPGSQGESLIRVIANDGINTGHDESDGPFTVPNRSPIPSITSPSDGQSFREGLPIAVRGSGFDPEDGQIAGEDLVWIIGGLGQVGTGKEITLFDLEWGLYELTLTATDNDGLQGSRTIEFRVGEFHQVFLPGVRH